MTPKPKHPEIAPPGKAWMTTGVGAGTPKAARPARHMPAVEGVRFAVLDGAPVRFNEAEAWWIAPVDGAWRPISLATVFAAANLLCDHAFARSLLPLPAHAFGEQDI